MASADVFVYGFPGCYSLVRRRGPRTYYSPREHSRKRFGPLTARFNGRYIGPLRLAPRGHFSRACVEQSAESSKSIVHILALLGLVGSVISLLKDG